MTRFDGGTEADWHWWRDMIALTGPNEEIGTCWQALIEE